MRLQHSFPRFPDAAATQAALRGYLAAVADLAAPKRALPLLWDAPRLDAFHAGISAALRRKPGAPPLHCDCRLSLRNTLIFSCAWESILITPEQQKFNTLEVFRE